MIILFLNPCPAPRMTRSDKWKTNPNHIDPKKRQRVCVQKYFQFKKDFKRLCDLNKWELKSEIKLKFILPVSDSWSNKKKNDMINKPHQQRPDLDNLVKAICDSFGVDDGFVSKIEAEKYWGEKGEIWLY